MRRAYLERLLDKHTLVQVVEVAQQVLDVLVDALKQQVEALEDADVVFLELFVALEQVLLLKSRSGHTEKRETKRDKDVRGCPRCVWCKTRTL